MFFSKKLTFLERIMVQHAHPVKFVLETIGVMWAVYELWLGNVPLAIAFGIGLPLIGTIAVWGHNEAYLAKTWFGKFMLLHANPVNFFFHAVGFVVLIAGIYGHMTEMILWGLTIVIFGHLWGWGRVDKHIK